MSYRNKLGIRRANTTDEGAREWQALEYWAEERARARRADKRRKLWRNRLWVALAFSAAIAPLALILTK